jgi:hypothetical protein
MHQIFFGIFCTNFGKVILLQLQIYKFYGYKFKHIHEKHRTLLIIFTFSSKFISEKVNFDSPKAKNYISSWTMRQSCKFVPQNSRRNKTRKNVCGGGF